MQLMPIFTLEDVLNRKTNRESEFSVAYLFDTQVDISSISEDMQENVMICSSDDVPQGRGIVDTVQLPFGIGDVFYLQEPFRLYAWDREAGFFVFQYKDNTLGTVEITDPQTVYGLLGDTDMPDGTVEKDAEFYREHPDLRKITRWRPSNQLPKEAMRVVKTVESAQPVRIKNMDNEQLNALGFNSMDSFIERVHCYQSEAGLNNWVLLVGLGDLEPPTFDFEDAGDDMPRF